MVRHIVLIKFREDASEEARQELINLSQWSRKADYVSGYACGWGVEPNPYAGAGDEWDWGMSLDLSEEDVARYSDDPTHSAIPQEVIDCAEKFAILDFVME
jgi:hypothetical protein